MSETHDILIIGAGISGLGLAHGCLARGLRPLLLEQAPHPGGLLHSARHLGCSPEVEPFWVELGAHSCFNSYGHLLGMLEQHQLLPKIRKRRALSFKLWRDGRLKGIAGQLRWLELLSSLPRLFSSRKDGQSVASYFTPIVGPNNYREVFSPAFNAVICQPADDFPADMLFRKKPRRKDVPKGFTFNYGLQSLAEALAGIPGLTLYCSQTVERIVREQQDFVVTAGDHTYRAARLAIATPVDEAARLLGEIAPQVAELLGQVAVAQTESVGVVAYKEDIRLPRLGGIIGGAAPFYSVVSRDTVDHPRYRGFSFHFKPGLLDEAAQDQVIEQVLGTRHWLEHVRKTNQLPAPVSGHHALIAELDKLLAGQPVLLAGNYFLGVSIEDCLTRSFSEASRLA